jgi:predicted AlkP superfamily phosphohydrolase/phosphomutase
MWSVARTDSAAGCGGSQHKRVIVIGVDGMDPVFVERHWADLPNLARLRQRGSYSHLETTDPPQSPVAWSTFITGLDPGEHGIFDFVHRDPVTLEPYLSTDKTLGPRFTLHRSDLMGIAAFAFARGLTA